jgi:hypothetical protein
MTALGPTRTFGGVCKAVAIGGKADMLPAADAVIEGARSILIRSSPRRKTLVTHGPASAPLRAVRLSRQLTRNTAYALCPAFRRSLCLCEGRRRLDTSAR